MRVLVDPEAFRHGRCGMTRYYAAVCEGLRASGIEVDLPVVLSDSEFVPDQFDPIRILPRALGSKLVRYGERLSRRLFHSRLKAGNYDVILPTSAHHDTTFLEHSGGKPFIIICHDTIRSVPIPGGSIDAWVEPLHKLLYLARRAACVVCVSEATRRDLLHSKSVDPEKVAVVRTANLLPLRAPSGCPVAGLPEKYLFFVGSRQVRKNFDGALRALAPLLRRGDDIRLVCTGRFSIWENDLLDALGLTDQVRGLDLTDAELVTTYERAIALVYPTYYEGFGLPVLEAMAAGCPVLTSNTSSLPEVAGDAALLVDPADHVALLREATRLVDDAALRARLSGAGRSRAESFTLDAMMNGLIEQLHLAASRGPRISR